MAKYQLTADLKSENFCFDYTHFLSASCKKRWSFIDAIYGVMPIFGIVTKTPPRHTQTHQEQLKALALQVLSTQVNDETNIIRLISLAERKGIFRFDIRLPYALENAQLAVIQHEFGDALSLHQQDERLSIRLTPMTEKPAA